jgi:outer membrane receptor protein involved in Fe transport
MSVKTISLLLVLAAIALGATSIAAQTSRGTVTGIVTDPQDQVVSGADVELKNPLTNVSRTTTTNDAGLYRFDAVDLGNYEVIIRAKGFKTSSTAGVASQANRITTVDVKMEVGTQEETVNVNAGVGELLQTSEPVRGGNFNAAQVQSLPSANLNPYDLGRLLPGVTTNLGGASFGNASQFSVNGQRPRGNSYLIDGTENNDISVTGPATQINNDDAVAEVSIQTGLFSAEFGRAGGGLFNVITKGGTNDFHGSVRWLLQSQWFNSLTSTEKGVSKLAELPVFTENTFGGTIGGPLPLPRFGEGGKSFFRGRDKNFFFFGLQWDRFRSSSLLNPVIPTTAGFNALRTLFPVGTNPRVDLYLQSIGNFRGNPGQATTNVALGTGPNGAGVSVARGSIEFAQANVSYSAPANDRQWVLRTDHIINDKHTVSVRYTDDHNVTIKNTIAVTPEFVTDFGGNSRNFLVTHTWTINSSITNELRVSPYGLIDFQFIFPGDVTILSETMPNIAFTGSGVSTIGNATNLPQFRTAKNFLVQDTMTKVWGGHTFRFGFETLRQTARQRPPFNERGSFGFRTGGGFNAFANFVDNFSGASGTAAKNFGIPFYNPNLLRKSFFFQDTWKKSADLTLTLGLRYEDFGQPANNAFKFPAFAGFDPAQFLVPNKVNEDKNNLGPVFGFAYAPHVKGGPLGWMFGEGQGVLRGGYQISYDTWFNNLLSNIAVDSPNNPATTIAAASSGRGNASFFPNALPAVQATPAITDSQTSVFNKDIKNPMTQRWSLGWQRELPWNLIMDMSYVGTAGRNLFVTEDLNPIIHPNLTTTACPNCGRKFPAFGVRRYRTSGANSDYHSGQFRLDKRFSQGLLFTASYTWAKLIDQVSEVFNTNQTGGASTASYPAYLGGLITDRGVSDYHRGHRFTLAYVWDLPLFRGRNDWAGKLLGGWRINGITTFQSGAPFSILNGLDRDGDGISGNDRPDIGNPNAPHNTRGIIDAACSTGFRSPELSATAGSGCVSRNDIYAVQVATNTGANLLIPTSALGRNTERSNPVKNFDMSFFKTFRYNERLKFELRFESFNIFNHPQRTGLAGADVTNTLGINTSTGLPGRFLNYDFVSGGRRSGRVGLKIIF